MDVSKQSVLRQDRHGTNDAAKGDITTGLKTGWGTVEKSKCGQNAFIGPSAGCSHFGRGILDGSVDLSVPTGGCTTEAVSGVDSLG